MAWKAGIAAEVIAPTEKAIGTEIYFAKAYFETADLFAWTLTVIILSILIEKLLILGLSKLAGRLRVSEVQNDKI
jgi:NitT/TauT family transport system permease protein